MTTLNLREETTLPTDRFAGALAGRVWRPDVDGPSVVAVRDNGVFDISAAFPTMRDLCEAPSPAEALHAADGPRIGPLSDILAQTPRDNRASGGPRLLAPIDLQAIKAAGVTFAESLLERVIEERARGSRDGAAKARSAVPCAKSSSRAKRLAKIERVGVLVRVVRACPERAPAGGIPGSRARRTAHRSGECGWTH